ncbi:hypothetical protein SO694_00006168 [Aureococcus anophagefferens]|uniref:Uncharacterized protein n=1 Tax=Aureococcus anophagefferens TaxID=44056 RepID=A0ABR1G9V3_AURAN
MVNTPRQKAYAMGGKRHSHDHEGIGVQQSSVGALIGKSDAAMKKRLGISDADEARRTVETLAACGGVSALAAACGSSVGDFGSGLWTGDDVARACGAVLEANGRAAPSRGALEFLFRAARTGGAHAGSRAAATPLDGLVLARAFRAAAAPAVVRALENAFDAKFPGGAAPVPALGALVNGAMPPAFLDCFRVEGGAVSREAWVDGHVDHCRGVRGFPDAPATTTSCSRPRGTRRRRRRRAPYAAARACPGLAPATSAPVAAVFAGRSRPPDASLRVLFDALSAAPPGAHLSDARVVAPAARGRAPRDKRPARALRAARRALAALGGPASVGALLANYAASKHPWSSRGRCPRQKPRTSSASRSRHGGARSTRALDVSRRAFLDACADLSYCCGDGPDGDAKYALRLGPPCGAATAAPAPRRRLACVTGRDGERSIAYVDDDGDADFPDEPWTEARLFQALGARLCTQVHIGDDGGPAAEGVATREKRKVWRKPAPAAARTRDFSGVSLRHGPDLSLSSLTHDPVSPRLRPAAQTAHTGLHTSSWSIGDGGC